MKFKTLSPTIKRTIVMALGGGATPSEVVLLVREQFNTQITRQAVQKYNPRTATGSNLSADLKALFESTRAKALEDLESLDTAYRTMRVAALQRVYERAVTAHDDRTALRALDQIRIEMIGIELVDIDPPEGDEAW